MKWKLRFRLRHQFEGFSADVRIGQLLFSWDGRYLFGMEERSMKGLFVWEVENNFELRHIPLQWTYPKCAVACSDGFLILSENRGRFFLQLYDIDSWRLVYEHQCEHDTRFIGRKEMSLNPHHPEHVAITIDHRIVIWDSHAGSVVRTYEDEDVFRGVLYTDKYLIGRTETKMIVWDIQTGERVVDFPFPDLHWSWARTKHPSKIIMATRESTSVQFDILTQKVEREFHAGGNFVTHLETNTLAAGSLNFLDVFDLDTGDPVQIEMKSGYIQTIAISRDGQWLVANGNTVWENIADAIPQHPIFSAEDWFAAALIDFRKHGFFRDLKDMPESEVVEIVRERGRSERFSEKLTSSYALMRVLALDEGSVWWQDLEADVSPHNRVYEEVLAEWASISRGEFAPNDIQETWQDVDSESPPILTFELNGNSVRLEPADLSDYIDLSILRKINDLIADSPIRFEVYQFFDQTAVVLAITAEEKYYLTHELSFVFID